jgi:hypothetical protein
MYELRASLCLLLFSFALLPLLLCSVSPPLYKWLYHPLFVGMDASIKFWLGLSVELQRT